MTHLSEERAGELRRIAEAATQGNWGIEDPMDHCLSIVSNPDAPTYDWIFVASCDLPDEDDHFITGSEVKANAAHIAAFDPPTVLALLSDHAALVAAAQAVVDCWGVGRLNITAMSEFVDELRALLPTQTRET